MSGVTDNKHHSNNKLNGNTILNVNAVATTATTGTTAATTAAKLSEAIELATAGNTNSNNGNSNNSNNKLLSHLQQKAAAIANSNSSKLPPPQQHHHHMQQRRSLLPQTHISTSPPTTANQLQTVATVHQQQSPPTTTAAATAPTAIPSLAQQHQQLHANSNSNHNVRRSFYQLHTLKNANSGSNLKSAATAHSIPPRYQPPPQPNVHLTNGNVAPGILKHLPLSVGSNKDNKTSTSYFNEANFKYSAELPQQQQQPQQQPLATAYQGNSARYLPTSNQQHASKLQLQQKYNSNLQQQTEQQQQQQQHQLQQQNMLKFVRKTDQDHPSPVASVTSSGTGIPTATGRLTVEQNRQLQSLINELRALKEQNQRLLDDNQELRDLCCFLDDDRQKGRKLAREWQRFGRYTASVMRQEVAAYQSKLRQLDDKQQELITDNLELKELCLYLDEERAHVAANALCTNCGASTRNNPLRDDGDGSSSSTNADETITALRNFERQMPVMKNQDMHLRNSLHDQTLQYVRSLERRIQQLEEERMTANVIAVATQQQQQQQKQQQQQQSTKQLQQEQLAQQQQQQQLQTHQQQQHLQDQDLPEPISGRPEAVVRALQVLEVREQLERDRLNTTNGGNTIDQMDDGEKALVREMCNVVWRKLEGSPNAANVLEL